MCECDLCEWRSYLLFLLLENIQLNIQTTQKSNKQRMSSSEHGLESTVNWINIFPEWLCFTAAYFSPFNCADMSFSSSTSLQSIFLRADGNAAVAGTRRRSTAHCPGQKQTDQVQGVWSHMSGGESESWGMAESQGDIKDFLKNNCDCVFFLQLHTCEDQRKRHKDEENPPLWGNVAHPHFFSATVQVSGLW